jgi:uncharacterized membrane protein YfcA
MELFLSHAPVLIPLLIFLGVFSGFSAGLLGIGGGAILVPGLFYLFKTLGYDPAHLMHLALGTSMATIIATGLSSSCAHYKKGAVRFDLVRNIAPGIVVGVAAGTYVAGLLSGPSLMLFFAVMLFLFSGLMILPPKMIPHEQSGPRQPLASVGGFGVGGVSALMGIGGATLNVPFMTLNGVSIHQAVASASVMGPIIAIPATIGYMLIGRDVMGLPPFSLGFVNGLAFLALAPFSMLAAPWGAKLAHRLPVKTLRMVFALFILAIAIQMLLEGLNDTSF